MRLRPMVFITHMPGKKGAILRLIPGKLLRVNFRHCEWEHYWFTIEHFGIFWKNVLHLFPSRDYTKSNKAIPKKGPSAPRDPHLLDELYNQNIAMPPRPRLEPQLNLFWLKGHRFVSSSPQFFLSSFLLRMVVGYGILSRSHYTGEVCYLFLLRW